MLYTIDVSGHLKNAGSSRISGKSHSFQALPGSLRTRASTPKNEAEHHKAPSLAEHGNEVSWGIRPMNPINPR